MGKISAYFDSYRNPPGDRYVDVLDGIRVLCVLLVGWFHIWQQSWLSPTLVIGNQVISLDFLLRSGYIWVDGLLLVSGFLLYLPFTVGNKPPAILPFYKKRLIRIVPSYVLSMIPMFILAIVRGQYGSWQHAARDMAAHLTFTHTLFPFSYYGSPINGALWTLGVEMQFYFIFPFLARAFKKYPLVTWCAMTGVAFAFRGYAATLPDCAMHFNQLPAFLDVYANGFLAASVYAVLRKRLGKEKTDPRIRLFFTVVFILCVCQFVTIAKGQAASGTQERIRLGQMERRFPLSVTLCCAMLSAAFSLPALRFFLGNPVMKFLSSISFQFYIYHQVFAVQLKSWGFPPSEYPSPWSAGDYPWQFSYTLCCFLGALLIAFLVTYLFEIPIARRLRRGMDAKA